MQNHRIVVHDEDFLPRRLRILHRSAIRNRQPAIGRCDRHEDAEEGAAFDPRKQIQSAAMGRQDAVGDGQAETLLTWLGGEERLSEQLPVNVRGQAAAGVGDGDFQMPAGLHVAEQIARFAGAHLNGPD